MLSFGIGVDTDTPGTSGHARPREHMPTTLCRHWSQSPNVFLESSKPWGAWLSCLGRLELQKPTYYRPSTGSVASVITIASVSVDVSAAVTVSVVERGWVGMRLYIIYYIISLLMNSYLISFSVIPGYIFNLTVGTNIHSSRSLSVLYPTPHGMNTLIPT